jgi:hypothetical protein
MNIAPPCPDGLLELNLECEGVDLVCFFEYTPAESGSKDSMGLLYEPDTTAECTLVSAYVGDVDIAHLLLQYLVNDLETTAIEYTQEDQDDNY